MFYPAKRFYHNLYFTGRREFINDERLGSWETNKLHGGRTIREQTRGIQAQDRARFREVWLADQTRRDAVQNQRGMQDTDVSQGRRISMFGIILSFFLLNSPAVLWILNSSLIPLKRKLHSHMNSLFLSKKKHIKNYSEKKVFNFFLNLFSGSRFFKFNSLLYNSQLEEERLLASGRTKIPGLKVRMELAWQKEREEQQRLLQETATLARDLRQTLFEV